MELEEQGLRLSLVLGNASALKCAASALAVTATVLLSLLELLAQVAVLEHEYDEVVDAEEANGNNAGSDGDGDDAGEDQEGGGTDAVEGKDTKKVPPSCPEEIGEAGDDEDDDEPEGGGDDNNDDDDDDDHENEDEDDDDEDHEDEDGGEDDEDEEAELEEEEDDDEALQPPKKRKK